MHYYYHHSHILQHLQTTNQYAAAYAATNIAVRVARMQMLGPPEQPVSDAVSRVRTGAEEDQSAFGYVVTQRGICDSGDGIGLAVDRSDVILMSAVSF